MGQVNDLRRSVTLVALAAAMLAGCPASWRTETPQPSASLAVQPRRDGDRLVLDYQVVNRGRDPIYAFVHPPRPEGSTTAPGDAAYVYFPRSGVATIGLAPLIRQPLAIYGPPLGSWAPPVYTGAIRISPHNHYSGTVNLPLPLTLVEAYGGYVTSTDYGPTTTGVITTVTLEVAYMDWRDVDITTSYVERSKLYYLTLPDIQVRGPTREPARQSGNLHYMTATVTIEVPADLPAPEFLQRTPPRPELPYPVH